MSLLPILSKVRDLNSFSTCAIISGVTFTPLFTGDISSFIADSEDDDDSLFFALGVVAATFLGDVGVVLSVVDTAPFFFIGPADDTFGIFSSLLDISSSASLLSDALTAIGADFSSV